MLTATDNLIADITMKANEFCHVEGDKPAIHAKTKELIKLLKELERQTQPGVGEFKWTAAARKGLTTPAGMIKNPPTLKIGRDSQGDIWHTDGCYMVKGEPSKRFEPVTLHELPPGAVNHVIPAMLGDYRAVTVAGAASDKTPGYDTVELSDGAILNRLYLAYVTATIGGDVVILSRGPLAPVVLQRDGVTLGLIMPIKPAIFGKTK